MTAADERERAQGIVATAFLTHGPIQTINQFKEQLRWDVVDNQVTKVGQVFLGLTLGCARCHDHKFDPVMQNDYYALAGIFQNLQLLNGFLGSSKVFSDWHRVPLPDVPRGLVQVASPGANIPGSPSRSIPPNASGRLQLVEWLTDPKNPLTARVIVNRIWHHVSGAGIVRSVDNFGLRGDRPTHSE